MDEAAKLRTAGSNVFLGGTPASERFDTSYATTFVDTKDMLVDESKNTAALREGELCDTAWHLGSPHMTLWSGDTGGSDRSNRGQLSHTLCAAIAPPCRVLGVVVRQTCGSRGRYSTLS